MHTSAALLIMFTISWYWCRSSADRFSTWRDTFVIYKKIHELVPISLITMYAIYTNEIVTIFWRMAITLFSTTFNVPWMVTMICVRIKCLVIWTFLCHQHARAALSEMRAVSIDCLSSATDRSALTIVTF